MILSKDYINNNLYVIDAFYDSKRIAESKILEQTFSKIFWFKSKKDALHAATIQRPSTIFIDSDVGVKNLLDLCKFKIKSLRTEINVYEEGLGTYRNNFVNSNTRKMVLNLFGVGCYFGGCFLTKKIHVFEPEIYSQKIPSLKEKAVKISIDFSKWIHENKNELIAIFSPGFKIWCSSNQNTAHLYLSDWNIDANFIKNSLNLDNFYIKLHPHIKNAFTNDFKQLLFIPQSLPAEVALILLIEKFKTITVYHKNSSCMHYVSSTKIKSVDF